MPTELNIEKFIESAPVIAQRPKFSLPDTPKKEDTNIKEKAKKLTDMESNFGRYWLNKIGIVVFTLGIGFLISYTFKHFTPILKIAFGYALSCGIFFFALKLEKKEQYAQFGRVLLGGGWAMVYFTTYAMHHFDASGIIQSQLLDMFLLFFVVGGMISHTLKYRSENMMSVALFIAYITATLGQITFFTFFSSLLLAIVVLMLAHKMQWVKTLTLGIVLTFGIHHFWIMPKIFLAGAKSSALGVPPGQYPHLLNFCFLSAYWLVFMIGLHISKVVSKAEASENSFPAANFGNFFLYVLMAYPLVNRLFYAQRFEIVLGFGVIYLIAAFLMKKCGREKFYVSNLIIAVLAITISVPLKYSQISTLLMWFVEIPFLLFLGFNFKQKILVFLSYVLTAVIFIKFVFLLGLQNMPETILWGNLVFAWHEFVFFWAAISMGVCSYISQRFKNKIDFGSSEINADQIFSVLSVTCLTTFICLVVEKQWITLCISSEVLVLFIMGALFSLKRLRVYCYGLLMLVIVRFLFMDSYPIREFSHILKWTLLSSEIFVFFVLYFIAKYMKEKCGESVAAFEFKFLFTGGNLLLMATIFQYVPQGWITFCLSMQTLALYSSSINFRDILFRRYCYFLLVIVAIRLAFIDQYVMASALKWFMISTEVLVPFILYFYGTHLKPSINKSVSEANEYQMIFGGGVIILVCAVFRFVQWEWISLVLGIAGVLIIFGMMDKDKAL